MTGPRPFLIAALAVLVVSGAGCSAVDLRERNADLERENHALLQERNSAENQLAVAQGRMTTMGEELREARAKIIDLRADLDAARNAEPVFSGYEEDDAPMTEEESRGEILEILAGTVLFAPGKAALTKEGRAALNSTVARIRRDHANAYIRVEGHTDSTPTVKTKAKYPTNWELSAHRACSVLRYLIEQGAATEDRIEAIGLGDTQPVAGNDSADGRAKNRRVVIRVR